MAMSAVDEGDTVVLSLEGPRAQRRATVAFRAILAIPAWLYLAIISVVVFFAVVAGWFAALVLGRLPAGLAEFIARALQYMTRVYAYGQLLLTDTYPPFRLGPADYPVELEIEEPGGLNRAAVLFRIVLLIPAAFVAQVSMGGLAVALFVIWLIVLMAGRVPHALFEAEAAVFRYQMRTWAYAAMLTSEYPRGLFGDKEREPALESPPSLDDLVPTAAALPPELPARPRINRLVLSRAARRLVILFIVLGVVFQVGVQAVTVATTLADDDLEDLEAWYEDVELAFGVYLTDIQRCAPTADEGCALAAFGELRTDLVRFSDELRAMDLPESALGEANAVNNDIVSMIDALDRLSTTVDEQVIEEQVVRFQQAALQFDEDFNRLYDAVRFG